MDLVNRYAAALSLHPARVRGGRRGRRRDHRAVRRRAPRPRRLLRVAAPRRRVRGRRRRAAQAARARSARRLHRGRRRGRRRRGRERPGPLGVRRALRRRAGRPESRSTRSRPTTAMSISGWPDELPTQRHAADARRSVLVPDGRLPAALQRAGAGARRDGRHGVGGRRAGRRTASCSTIAIMTTRRGRGDVLRGRADARGRVAGLPADRQAAHRHARRAQPRARARGPAGDGTPAGDRSGGERRGPRADARRAARRPRRRRAPARLRARRLPRAQRARRRPATGALAIGEQVDVGQTVQFQVRDADAADEDLRCLLAGVSRRRRRCCSPATVAGPHLFPEPDHDAAVVEELLGPVPLAGAFCAGEIGPDRRPQLPARLHRQRRRLRAERALASIVPRAPASRVIRLRANRVRRWRCTSTTEESRVTTESQVADDLEQRGRST